MNRIIGVLMVTTCQLWTSVSIAEEAEVKGDAPSAPTETATQASAVTASPSAPQTPSSQAAAPSTVAPSAPTSAVPKPAPVYGPQPQPPSVYESYEARLAYREAVRKERLKRKIDARKRGRPFIMAGAVSLGVGYMVSAVVASVLVLDFDNNDAAFMYVPIVGNPIFFSRIIKEEEAEDRLYGEDEFEDVEDEGNFALAMALFTPAIAQLTGTVLLSFGLARRSRYKRESEKGAAVSVAPIITRETRGLSLSMTF